MDLLHAWWERAGHVHGELHAGGSWTCAENLVCSCVQRGLSTDGGRRMCMLARVGGLGWSRARVSSVGKVCSSQKEEDPIGHRCAQPLGVGPNLLECVLGFDSGQLWDQKKRPNRSHWVQMDLRPIQKKIK